MDEFKNALPGGDCALGRVLEPGGKFHLLISLSHVDPEARADDYDRDDDEPAATAAADVSDHPWAACNGATRHETQLDGPRSIIPPFPMRLMHRAAGTVRRLLHSAVITLILPRKEGFRVLPVIELSLGCSWQGEMTTGRAQDKAYFLCWARKHHHCCDAASCVCITQDVRRRRGQQCAGRRNR